MHAPSTIHHQAIRHVLRFVKGTTHDGLSWLKTHSLMLIGKDVLRLAYVLQAIETNCVSCTAKKQPTVSRSSTKAIVAFEIHSSFFLLRDIGVSLSTSKEIRSTHS